MSDKLNTLLARVDACRTRLDRVPLILKQFRQAVLAAAMSGELTESARHELKTKEETTTTLGQAVVHLKTGPFGSTLHKSDYILNGIPVINPMHINAGRIIPTDDMSISEEKAQELQEFRLKEGDVVLARRGVMGRCAVVGATEDGWLCGSGSMFMRPADHVLPTYLQIFLSSPKSVKALEAEAVGSTMVNLNQKILLGLEMSVPSIEEQNEIVRRVEILFTYANSLELHYQTARAQIEQLTPNLLDKAFRGELVPQNPKDESASALIERIRVARAAQPIKLKRNLNDRKPTMTKMTRESVKKVIQQFPKEMFSFDDLRKSLAGDYDLLKDIVFGLLGEAEPSIAQVFDQDAKAICFVRREK